MLGNRDRWMQDFVLEREPEWDLLRARLEAPFLRADGEITPIRYSDAEWQIVCACFNLLRRAAAELRVVFAESATADFTEVAQIALSVLKGEDGFPTDTAQAVADGIRHLLVDEFQDTSRRQHELLRRLIAAWSDREGRTCFVVGDPMQSIYGFREADAELFPRVEKLGLEIPGDLAFPFDRRPSHRQLPQRALAGRERQRNLRSGLRRLQRQRHQLRCIATCARRRCATRPAPRRHARSSHAASRRIYSGCGRQLRARSQKADCRRAQSCGDEANRRNRRDRSHSPSSH